MVFHDGKSLQQTGVSQIDGGRRRAGSLLLHHPASRHAAGTPDPALLPTEHWTTRQSLYQAGVSPNVQILSKAEVETQAASQSVEEHLTPCAKA